MHSRTPRPVPDLRWRLRRWMREIVLACALTVAALAYLLATTTGERNEAPRSSGGGTAQLPVKG